MEKKQFKAESQRLMDLMINSIYTHKEIFLREIISNASDAIDKLAYRALTDDQVGLNRDDFKIVVVPDKEARTLTVSDNGIGMTQEEMENNLGTIAKSGSLQFKKETEKTDDAEIDIIGQFGVGFYSAFMVADKVTVISKAYGADTAYKWESEGVDGYTIEPCEKDTVGTDVIMSIKPDSEEEKYDEYLEAYKLSGLIKKYSDYIRYPIRMEMEHSKPKPKPEDAGEDYKPENETVKEWETINSMIPIWQRPKSQVKDEEYNEFYKSDFHDFEDPARTISLHAEGALTYDALLFVPGHAPYDMYSKDYKKGLALYSSGVLIMEKCEELVPDYFNFVRGVVDSADLTLNISRETLQHNGQLKAIARRIEKKIKSDLASMRDDDREAYEKFFGEFGRAMKFGVYSTYGMAKDVLADLLLFYSAKQKKMITLDEYLADAPADSDAIYFATGDSIERMAQMPIVTTVLAKGHDVLLCNENVDEFCMMALGSYSNDSVVSLGDDGESTPKTFTLKNVGGDDLGLTSEEEKKEAEEATTENSDLFGVMKEALGEKVEKVVVSTRLTDAPAVLTTEGAVSLKMAQMFNAQATASEERPEIHVVLELNDKHPVFGVLKAAHAAGDDDKVKNYAGILFDQAMLMEGLPIDDPIAFAQAVTALMK